MNKKSPVLCKERGIFVKLAGIYGCALGAAAPPSLTALLNRSTHLGDLQVAPYVHDCPWQGIYLLALNSAHKGGSPTLNAPEFPQYFLLAIIFY